MACLEPGSPLPHEMVATALDRQPGQPVVQRQAGVRLHCICPEAAVGYVPGVGLQEMTAGRLGRSKSFRRSRSNAFLQAREYSTQELRLVLCQASL